MAELTQAAFDALVEENTALKAKVREITDSFNEQLKNIKNTVEHGGALAIRPKEPVDGVFSIDYNDPATGKKVKQKVKFVDGHQRVRLADGEIVSSAALMRIAEGGEATEGELRAFPALVNLKKEQAADRLTDLWKMNYPYLVKA